MTPYHCDTCLNVWRFCDAYDILYICHLRRSDEAGATWNRTWTTTVEEWTSRSGTTGLIRVRSGPHPKNPLLNRVPFADDVRCWACRISSSANVPLTCERCGDSARHLSCVYDGQWKRAFRVNTRVVHFAVSQRSVRSVPRSLYNCFTHLQSYLPYA